MQKFAIRSMLGLMLGMVFLTGCARGPSGPVVPPVGANRLTVNMTLQQPINPVFFYDFAFDDDNDPSDGPGAFIGTTLAPNGVVGNSFSVLVQYRGGQFIAFRRTDLGNGDERLERASNAFIGVPSANGTTISFTLDLDAKIDVDPNPAVPDDDFLFARNMTQLDVNFVTTSEVIRDPNNLNLKPFDALSEFPGVASSFTTFDIRSTRTYRNADTVHEPTNDANAGNSAITAQQLAQLDITDFTLEVRRS